MTTRTQARIDAAGLVKGLGASYGTKFGILIVALFSWLLLSIISPEIPLLGQVRSLRHLLFEHWTFSAASFVGAFVGGCAGAMMSRRTGVATGIAVGAAIMVLRIAHHLMTTSSETRDITTTELLTTAAVVPIAWLGAKLGHKRRCREDRRIEQLDGWKRPLGDDRRTRRLWP